MAAVSVIELGDEKLQTECLQRIFSVLENSLDSETLEELAAAVYTREDTASTYLGESLAVPHGRVVGLGQTRVVAALSRAGVDWPTSENRAHLVVLVGVDRSKVSEYLFILQKIIRWRRSIPGKIETLGIDRIEAELSREIAGK